MDCSTPVFPSPSLSPGVCPNSCPFSQWCHPTISSSVAHFSPCPQSFPASGSFPISQQFALGGQSIGASVLPMNIQSWFPLGLTGLISLQSTSVEFHSVTQSCPPLCDLDSQSLLKLMSIQSVMPPNNLILCHPLHFLPSIFPSIRVFSNEWVTSSHQVAKVLEFQLQHQSF